MSPVRPRPQGPIRFIDWQFITSDEFANRALLVYNN